jgi:hypothetical protein
MWEKEPDSMQKNPQQPNNFVSPCDTCDHTRCAKCRHAVNTTNGETAIEGETLDGVMAQFMYQTIIYAQSFAAGTWHPDSSTLFQIAEKFPQN